MKRRYFAVLWMILRARNKFNMIRDSPLYNHPSDFIAEFGEDLLSFHFNLPKDLSYPTIRIFASIVDLPYRYSQLNQYKYILWLLEEYLPNAIIAEEFISWIKELGCSRIPLEEPFIAARANSN